MRLLITGTTGLLGSTLLQIASADPDLEITALSTSDVQSHPLLALQSQRVHFVGNYTVSDHEGVLRQLESVQPHCIIHCAALSSPLACHQDPHTAWLANAMSCEALAKAASRTHSFMVYVSTDLVFEGSSPQAAPFSELAPPNPLSVYARSKLAGEEHVLALGRNGAVARVSLLLGRSAGRSKGALGWMEDMFRKRQQLTLFDDEYRTPIWTEDAATSLLFLCRKRLSGIWHLGPNAEERISRLQLGLLIAEVMGYDPTLIIRTSRSEVPSPFQRPEDVSLESSKFATEFGRHATPMRLMLEKITRSPFNF